MKNILAGIIVVILLSGCTGQNDHKQQDKAFEGTISVSGAFALYPIIVKWSEEFRKIHPMVKIDISAGGSGKGITDALAKMTDIGMISRDVNTEELKNGAYTVTVVKDAVVITTSNSNPLLKYILSHGLKKETAIKIWITGDCKTWGDALGLANKIPIHVYTRSDAAGAAECFAKYLGEKQEDLSGTGVFGDPGLAMAIINDPLSIGYNNIAYVYDLHTRHTNPGLQVVPLDLDNNGKIDQTEDFYSDIDKLKNAISKGKYPSPPVRNLYLVTCGKPSKKVVVDFLRWILSDGQKFVDVSGYIQLPKETIEHELEKIQ